MVCDSAGAANEEHGEDWFGALAWSGSWRITVEQDQLDKVRVTGRLQPFDFGYVLKPNEKLESPIFYAGYTTDGMGGASRLLNHIRARRIFCRQSHGGAGSKAAASDLQLVGSNGVECDRGQAGGAGGEGGGTGRGSLCDG